VQLGGMADVGERVPVDAERLCDRLGEFRHAGEMIAETGMTLGERAQKHCFRLALRRRPAGLGGVHPFICAAKRIVRGGGVV
jgi:hypothetical protein